MLHCCDMMWLGVILKYLYNWINFTTLSHSLSMCSLYVLCVQVQEPIMGWNWHFGYKYVCKLMALTLLQNSKPHTTLFIDIPPLLLFSWRRICFNDDPSCFTVFSNTSTYNKYKERPIILLIKFYHASSLVHMSPTKVPNHKSLNSM